eukprot:2309222-Rhodomonas_salina.1
MQSPALTTIFSIALRIAYALVGIEEPRSAVPGHPRPTTGHGGQSTRRSPQVPSFYIAFRMH